MAPPRRAKRRKTVPSKAMKAMDEAARQAEKKKKKKNKRGKKRSGALEVERGLDDMEAPRRLPVISALKSTDVEAAHERAEQALAVQDMASHAATATLRLLSYCNGFSMSHL